MSCTKLNWESRAHKKLYLYSLKYLRLEKRIFYTSNNPINAPVWQRWNWSCLRKQNFNKLPIPINCWVHDRDSPILHCTKKLVVIQSGLKHKKDPNITCLLSNKKKGWDSQRFITMEVTDLDIAKKINYDATIWRKGRKISACKILIIDQVPKS